ncbi:MAG TPA: ABC transporter ATP-binding protein [Candidatus Scatomorpha intestinavium]|uniref:ABC transporter ATP-binding protein n=1 Tax=Candidatus Scatomorpha intestinavium TaxID=2840922 RepID=A0A9D1CTB6_9FIRM|nr:ABC transporter ATP-binding protein [Candidatus Scatomorpha intestinavium]
MKVEIQNLTKRFGQKTAVDDVSLALTSGVWGLIGANGAGKTTLMRMLAGILTPTSGRVLCDGADTRAMGEAWRDMLGYLPQHFGFYPEFTVADYLDYMAALKGLEKKFAREKIEELCEILSLTRVYRNKIKKLSGGTQRRVGIAQAMLNDPEVLILDEPTSGLDPGERVRFRNLLSEFARDRIVLISTHIVSDIEYIAAENAIMKDGKLIDVGTTEQLLRAVEGKVFTALVPDSFLGRVESEVRVVSLKNEGGGQTLVRYVADAPLLRGSEFAEPRLEDLYLWLFKDERRQDDV